MGETEMEQLQTTLFYRNPFANEGFESKHLFPSLQYCERLCTGWQGKNGTPSHHQTIFLVISTILSTPTIHQTKAEW